MATVATQMLGLHFELFLMEGKRQICTQADEDFVWKILITYHIGSSKRMQCAKAFLLAAYGLMSTAVLRWRACLKQFNIVNKHACDLKYPQTDRYGRLIVA